MENVNNEEKVEIEDELLEEGDFTEEQLNDDTFDWKTEAERLKGLNKRRASKLKKAKEILSKQKPTETPNPERPETTGFDYGQKAFLKASGINSDEFDFVLEASKDSGKPIEVLIESPWFKKELEERREAKKTQEAIPTNSKRTATPARDTVEYHIAKGTPLSEISDPKLRSDIVKERRRQATTGSQFSEHPVV